MSIRHVIWDFNGTLLDDVDCCIGTLNTMLAERALAPISRARYLAGFGFPVRNFYLELGFDFERERFDDVSASFMARYGGRLHEAAAHAGAHAALASLRERAVPQSVVSAMQLTLLRELLLRFGLSEYMTHVRGLDHLNATSKIDIGLALLHELRVAPSEVVLVGDTLHDLELAQAIGCHCMLFARGHQARERLALQVLPRIDGDVAPSASVTLIESLAEVAPFIDALAAQR
jgi:phosphoglycolate phosphatase